MAPDDVRSIAEFVSSDDADLQSEAARVFDDLLARSDSVRTTGSAIASLLLDRKGELSGHQGEAAEEAALRLNLAVDHWLRQRLWSLNLAPELVAHDERHVAAVENLVCSLVEPFWGKNAVRHSFSLIHLEWLAISAWLHDWGHVGGAVTPWKLGDRNALATESRDVRALHGLISQNLLAPRWRGMHALAPDLAGGAAILCGHHQSWTSFDRDRPEPTPPPDKNADAMDLKPDPVALLAEMGVQPKSLDEDVHQFEHPEARDLQQMRFLVALLRVADGADLGRHRVPDHGMARQGFLARCLHQEAMKTVAKLRSNDQHDRSIDASIEIALAVAYDALGGGTGDRLDEDLAVSDGQLAPEVIDLCRYRRFILKQERYFDDHKLVDGVRFEFSEGSFDAVVTPSSSNPDVVRRAVRAVAVDIKRELDKAGVGAVLGARGIRFRDARTPQALVEPVTMQIATADDD